jgi:hypothetical protein
MSKSKIKITTKIQPDAMSGAWRNSVQKWLSSVHSSVAAKAKAEKMGLVLSEIKETPTPKRLQKVPTLPNHISKSSLSL